MIRLAKQSYTNMQPTQDNGISHKHWCLSKKTSLLTYIEYKDL